MAAAIVGIAKPAQASTGINQQINYQARLLSSTGSIVPDGTYNLEFKIYQDGTGCVSSGSSPCGGTLKWTETWSGGNKVTVKNGYFSVQLGSVTAFGNNVDWNQDTLWLSINVGGTGTPSWDGEMTPFRRLAAVPYAFNSKQLGGLDASQFVQLAPSAVQVDSGTLSSIFINKSGASGNILELQKGGSDVLSVGNTGITTLASTLAVNGASITVGTTSTTNGTIVLDNSTNAFTTTLTAPNTATSSKTITFPNETGTVCTTGSVCSGYQASGSYANQTLNNLSSVAINTSLLAGSTSIDLGSTTASFRDLFLGGSATNYFRFTGTPTSTRTLTLSDNSGTLALLSPTAQQSGNLNISGTITSGTINSQTISSSANLTGTLAVNGASITVGTTSTTNGTLVLDNSTNAFTLTLQAPNTASSSKTITFPNETGTVCTTGSVCSGYQASGSYANAALSNLASVAINTSLLAGSTSIDLGSTTASFRDLFLGGSATNYFRFTGTPTSTRTLTLSDNSGTLALLSPTAQQSGNLNISGTITSGAINSQTISSSANLTGTLTVADNTTLNAQADLRWADADSSNWVAFQAPSTVSSNVTWTLPSADSAGCFQSNGSGTISIATCGDVKTETVTATGACTWTKSAGAIMVMVDLVGAGGGGGGGASNTGAVVRTGGSGGGGGAHAFKTFNASDLGSTESCSNGTGGTLGTAGASGGSGGDGGIGGNTTFGTTVRLSAGGGGGGKKGDNSALAGGGGGGGGAGEGSTGQAGGVGTTSGGAGGFPGTGTLATIGFGGAIGAVTGTTGGLADWGGAGGGGHTNVPANGPGGTSIHGGGGGGTGGGSTVTPGAIAGTAGGASGVWTAAGGGGGGAGTTGASPTVGTAGANGSGTAISGGGGGGGGGTITANTAGKAGGDGGAVGGGAGGGGVGSNTSGGGAGGTGGRGEIHVWTIKGTGADLAEIYSTSDPGIKAGDVVSLDSSLHAGVKKSSKSYDTQVFGIISTRPSLVMGSLDDSGGATPVMVALAGRVPVKVNLENGPIKAGDLLTSSSTPGEAMKATKSGQVIAQAMMDFDAVDSGANSGLVMAFVKNQNSNGSKLSNLVSGLSSSEVSAMPKIDQGKYALAELAIGKEQIAKSLDLSEITTDRVTAALDVITPQVTADNVSTNSLESTGGKDLTVKLKDSSKLSIKDSGKEEVASIDSQGNATFKGTLTVDKIKANQIEGLAVFTDKLGTLAEASLQAANTQTPTSSNLPASSSSTTSPSTLAGSTFAKDLTIGGTLFANGALRVAGPADFLGNSTFYKLASFIDRVVFHSKVNFEDTTTFQGTITVSNNTAGSIKVPVGQTSLKIQFSKPYEKPPIINITPVGIIAPKYGVVNVTEKDFEIQIDPAQDSETQFNWFAVEAPINF